MSIIDTTTTRLLNPAPGILAFYDGRVPGKRAYSPEPNWFDDGGYALGMASYAIVDGAEAIVYDTHMSVEHGRWVRNTLTGMGVRHMRVVLSHWHADHVAGNEMFADCEIIAHVWTDEALRQHKAELEAGTCMGPPAIKPLVLPTRTYEGSMPLEAGRVRVELRHLDIHSRDETVIWIPGTGLVLAGDTLEDTCTYVAEPEGFANHLRDLARMAAWPITRILPCHGDEEVIAKGGYGPGLITAGERYTRFLLDVAEGRDEGTRTLKEMVTEDLASGAITWFEPYETVHRRNVDRTLRFRRGD